LPDFVRFYELLKKVWGLEGCCGAAVD